MHVPAAACNHNSWQPGGVRGSPSMRHKAHPRDQREAIHALHGMGALRGRRSTRSEGLHGRRSMLFEGGDPGAPREVIHALQETQQILAAWRCSREPINATQGTSRGRRSTRSMGGDPHASREVFPRASRDAIHALRGRRSTRSEGCYPREVHALRGMLSKGGDPRASREVIHALQGR